MRQSHFCVYLRHLRELIRADGVGVLPYTPQAKINFIYNHLIIRDINRTAVTDIGRHVV